MATFPKITGNPAGGELFDRLSNKHPDSAEFEASGVNAGVYTIKLQSSVDLHEKSYAVVVIENPAAVGTFLSISEISIEDENGDPSTIFTLDPVALDSSGVATTDLFIGIQDASSSYAETKVRLFNAVDYDTTGTHTSATKVAAVELDVVTGELFFADDALNVTGYIPIYTTDTIIGTTIPGGEWGAFLIELDIRDSGVIDTVNHSLIINHNGSVGGTHDNYIIDLVATSLNNIVLFTSVNGVPITGFTNTMSVMDTLVGHSLGTTLIGSMSEVDQDVFNAAASYSDVDSFYANHNNLLYDAGSIFGAKWINIQDVSVLPQDMTITYTSSAGAVPIFSTATASGLELSATYTYGQNLAIQNSSAHAASSILPAADGIYNNFSDADATDADFAYVASSATDTAGVSFTIPWLIYPLTTIDPIFNPVAGFKYNKHSSAPTPFAGETTRVRHRTDEFDSYRDNTGESCRHKHAIDFTGPDVATDYNMAFNKVLNIRYNVRNVNEELTYNGLVPNTGTFETNRSILGGVGTAIGKVVVAAGASSIASLATTGVSVTPTEASNSPISAGSFRDYTLELETTADASDWTVTEQDFKLKLPVTSIPLPGGGRAPSVYTNQGFDPVELAYPIHIPECAPYLVMTPTGGGGPNSSGLEEFSSMEWLGDGTSLSDRPHDGLYDYGTSEYSFETALGTVSGVTFTLDTGTLNTDIVPGMIITSSGSSYTVLAVTSTTIVASSVIADMTTTQFVVSKPTVLVSGKTAQADITFASMNEASRKHKPYGIDLTWATKAIGAAILPGDMLLYSAAMGTTLFGGSTPDVGALTVVTNEDSTVIQAEAYEEHPTEYGMNNSQSVDIKSPRSSFDHRTRTQESVQYKPVTELDAGVYSSSMGIRFTNPGGGGLYIKSVTLEDPLYLPAGAFEIQPASATGVAWSLNEHYIVPPANSALPSETPQANQSPGAAEQSRVTINFSVNDTSSAGSYYKMVEVSYYRAHHATANQYVNGATNPVERTFGELELWKARRLVKFTVDQQAMISISDTDNSVIGFTGSISFGTISQ